MVADTLSRMCNHPVEEQVTQTADDEIHEDDYNFCSIERLEKKEQVTADVETQTWYVEQSNNCSIEQTKTEPEIV